MHARGVRGARGFTLIELIVVLFIIAMAAALVGPAIDSGMRTREVRSAVRALASAVRTMQGDAVRTGKVQILVLDPAQNVIGVDGTDRAISLGEVARLAELSDVTVDASGVARVRFFPNGSNTGLSVLVDDPDRPEDLGYVVHVDPLIGSVTVLDEQRK